MDVLRWAWGSVAAVFSWFWKSVGSLLASWWHSPEASAALTIALVAGTFAVYQLRLMPAERRGRILKGMINRYGEMAELRTAVLGEFPPLLVFGYAAVARAVEDEIAALERLPAAVTAGGEAGVRLAHLYHLRDEARVWHRAELEKSSTDIAFTDARELLDWEFKLRGMLWCGEALRAAEREPEHPWRPLIDSAEKLVKLLNDFVLEYENGAYPPRELFGQLHRSLAPTAKALEPLVWARSVKGRWGRRVLRIGLAAQHYNDVTRIHRNTPLVWDATDGGRKVRVVLHPARTVEYFGVEAPNRGLPARHRTRFVWQLNAQSLYWSLVGKLRLRPRRFVAYGGRRLRRHVKAEEAVAGCIRHLVEKSAKAENPIAPSTDFSWTLPDVRAELMRRAKAARRAGGTGGPGGGSAVADGEDAAAGGPADAPVPGPEAAGSPEPDATESSVAKPAGRAPAARGRAATAAARERAAHAAEQPPGRAASARRRERPSAANHAGAQPAPAQRPATRAAAKPPAERSASARQPAPKTPAERTRTERTRAGEPPAQPVAAAPRAARKRTAAQASPARRTAPKKSPVPPVATKEQARKKAP